MKLTAERFSEIVGALRTDARSAKRRRAPRVGFRAQLTIAVRRPDGVVGKSVVWTRDISAKGLSLTCPEAMEPGTRFLAHLEGPAANTDLIYRVVSCDPGPDGGIFHVSARLEGQAVPNACE